MHKTQNDRRELFIHHCEDIWGGGKCLVILLRLVLWHCYWPLLSCFCDKHHDQDSYRRKCLIGFAFSFRRLEFMMEEQRHGGRNGWELLILIGKRKQKEHMAVAQVSWNLKTWTQWHTSSNKITPPNPSQSVSPTGNQYSNI